MRVLYFISFSLALTLMVAPLAKAADDTVITGDPIALAYIAGQCEIPISPAHTNWLDSVKQGEYHSSIADAEERGAATLSAKIAMKGRHRACQNYRSKLAHMGWL